MTLLQHAYSSSVVLTARPYDPYTFCCCQHGWEPIMGRSITTSSCNDAARLKRMRASDYQNDATYPVELPGR